jgi:hypothetical protein
MNKGRHIGALLACGLAAAGMASVGLSSPAVASSAGPRPVSNWLRPVEAYTGTWVAIGWQAGFRICDVEIRVDGGRRVDVEYPGFGDYTSLSHGDSLGPFRGDVSAVRVYPGFTRGGVAQLRATIEYDNCGRHAHTQLRAFWLALPVRGGLGPIGGGHGFPDHPGGQNHPGDHNNHGTQSDDGYQSGSGTQPGGTQPGGTQPGGTQPGGTQPGGTQPGGSQPGGTQPGGSQSGGGYQSGGGSQSGGGTQAGGDQSGGSHSGGTHQSGGQTGGGAGR